VLVTGISSLLSHHSFTQKLISSSANFTHENNTESYIILAYGGYIYIITNKTHSTLYTGVTSNLYTRIWQHKNGIASTFTSKYNCTKLVYFEILDSMEGAIRREKTIKGYSRQWKLNLINRINPLWNDLFEDIEGMD
jgi:putative endonuclease